MTRKERKDKHLEEIEKVHQELKHCEEQKEKWEKIIFAEMGNLKNSNF